MAHRFAVAQGPSSLRPGMRPLWRLVGESVNPNFSQRTAPAVRSRTIAPRWSSEASKGAADEADIGNPRLAGRLPVKRAAERLKPNRQEPRFSDGRGW